ncbi:hypothetical protein BDA99DRAFT_562752 [Phascolomyces articulosus]|uniref:Uncharacterized protein n=1 Tax=Phascolomyces articulosus TaxID=60185 RepID=A0AAD5K6Z6_9FUNG|nr:hypothetical protein BDA99DRAFT_562752 [Phascolomyces articulosus]
MRYMKYTPKLSGLENVPRAIVAFHVYGHQPACQVQFNPKLVKGIGLVDGEGCERGWSMLSPYNIATRYMTEFNRHLFLTMLINHYHEQKIESLGRVIYKNYKKATKILTASNIKLRRVDIDELTRKWEHFKNETIKSKNESSKIDEKEKLRSAVFAYDFVNGIMHVPRTELIVRMRTALEKQIIDENLENKGVVELLKQKIAKTFKRFEKNRKLLSDSIPYSEEDRQNLTSLCLRAFTESSIPGIDTEQQGSDEDSSDENNDDDDENENENENDDDDVDIDIDVLVALLEGHDLFTDDNDDDIDNDDDADAADTTSQYLFIETFLNEYYIYFYIYQLVMVNSITY